MSYGLIRAYHLIITAYGFWLPNDPRGSWSDFVRAWELLRFGPATKTNERRSLARDPHDVALRREAKKHLAHKPVPFSGVQARAIARGFAQYVLRSDCIIHACSILHDHVHVVVARHHYPIERVSTLLKGAASTELLREGLHPFANEPYRDGRLPSPWARKEWSVFLHDDEQIRRAIRYVQNNPLKEGCKEQSWSFVVPFEPEADLRSSRYA